MAKVTSKLQVTVPKALAERYGIRPGDDIRFEEARREHPGGTCQGKPTSRKA